MAFCILVDRRRITEKDAEFRPVLKGKSDVALEPFVEMVQHRGLGQVGPVVHVRKVGEGDGRGRVGDDFGQERTRLVVGQVTSPSADSLFQASRIGATLQQSVVVIRFDRNVLTTPDVANEFVRPRTKVGDEGCTLALVAGDEGNVVRTAVRDRDGEDRQIWSELDGFEGNEGLPEVVNQAQFICGSVVGVDAQTPSTLSDEGATAVVAMVVGHEDGVHVGRVKVEQLQPAFKGRTAEPLVDQHTHVLGLEQGGVPLAP